MLAGARGWLQTGWRARAVGLLVGPPEGKRKEAYDKSASPHSLPNQYAPLEGRKYRDYKSATPLRWMYGT